MANLVYLWEKNIQKMVLFNNKIEQIFKSKEMMTRKWKEPWYRTKVNVISLSVKVNKRGTTVRLLII